MLQGTILDAHVVGEEEDTAMAGTESLEKFDRSRSEKAAKTRVIDRLELRECYGGRCSSRKIILCLVWHLRGFFILYQLQDRIGKSTVSGGDGSCRVFVLFMFIYFGRFGGFQIAL